MESADNDCSSVIIEPVYDSNLSAGLDAAHYYLGKSVKHSTRQQVRICVNDNKPQVFFFFLNYFLFGLVRQNLQYLAQLLSRKQSVRIRSRS